MAAIHSQLVKDLVIWVHLDNTEFHVPSFILLLQLLYVLNHYPPQEQIHEALTPPLREAEYRSSDSSFHSYSLSHRE